MLGSTTPPAAAVPGLLPLVVVDVVARVRHSGGDFRLAALHLRTWEHRHVRIPRGACVVLRTGCAGADVAPGWSDDALDWLLRRRLVRALGSDAPLVLPPDVDVPVLRCDPAALAGCRASGGWVRVDGAVTAVVTAPRTAATGPPGPPVYRDRLDAR